MIKVQKKDAIALAGIFIYSFFILLFFTKCSPFYIIQDWVDANAFFTVGKSMANGRVLYKDIFEQKGPMLYLMHMLAYYISNTTFFGVYIFEGLGLGVTLSCFYLICRKYLETLPSLCAVSLLPVFLLQTLFFAQGDSAEEFATPFMMGLLLLVINDINIKGDFSFSNLGYAVQGFCFCTVFLIKFTLCGAWIGFYIILSIYLIYRRRFKDFLRAFAFSALGFLLCLIPWIIYFVYNDALNDFIFVYFKFNIFIYPSGQQRLATTLLTAIGNIKDGYVSAPVSAAVSAFGVLTVLISGVISDKAPGRVMLAAMMGMTAVVAFIGGKAYHYYWLILMPFCCYGILAAFVLMKKYIKPTVLTTILCMFAGFLLVFFVNWTIADSIFYPDNSTYQIGAVEGETKEPAQIVFARIISETPDATLLNFNTLDVGLYTTTGIVPNTRYFMLQNIDYTIYPENYDEQLRCIIEKQVDYVVCASFTDVTYETLVPEELDQNYELISTHDQMRNSKATRFWLFKVKD